MQTTTTTAVGIQLPCPLCGEAKANINLYLWDTRTFFCGECETEFEADHVRELIDKWTKVLNWVDTMPKDE